MPESWRIVKARHAASAFGGEGAARTGGRWNSRGTPMVYTSATLSLAALEVLVHLNPPVLFSFKAFRVTFPESALERLDPGQVPKDWRTEPPPPSTQELGDLWVREERSPVLAVPSVLVPDEWNYLLHPNHPRIAEVLVDLPRDFHLDPRLFKA